MVTQPNLSPPKMTKVVAMCRQCGTVDEFVVPENALEARRRGKSLSGLLPRHRVTQIVKQICGACAGTAFQPRNSAPGQCNNCGRAATEHEGDGSPCPTSRP